MIVTAVMKRGGHTPRALILSLALSIAPSVSALASDNVGQVGPSNRVALVIGQSDYSGAPLKNINDAAPISQTLNDAGFEVEIGRDVEKNAILEKLSVLSDKSQLMGEDTTVLVYLSGRFAQINGENVFLPVGAKIDTAASASLNGFTMSQLVNVLKTLPAKSRVIMIDGNAPPENLTKEKTFSPGLVKIDAPEGFLISYNQRPGVPLVENVEHTSPYAEGLLEAVQTPTRNFSDVFQIVRQRVYEKTQGALQPFSVDNLVVKNFSFYRPTGETVSINEFYAAESDASAIQALPRDEAYKKVIAIDSIQSYQSFVAAFPNDPAADAIKYNLAARREAEIWSRALTLDTPEAYWTYLTQYPNGGNVSVARYRLEKMGEMDLAPPSNFQPIKFNDIPPPLPQYETVAAASPSLRAPPVAPSLNISPAPVAVAATIAAVSAVALSNNSGSRGAAPVALPPPPRPAWAAPPSANRTVRGTTVAPTISNTVRPSAMAPASASPSASPQNRIVTPTNVPDTSRGLPAPTQTVPSVQPRTAPLAAPVAAPTTAPLGAPSGAPAPAASPATVAPSAQPSAVVAPRSPAVGTSAAPAAVQPLVGTAPAAPVGTATPSPATPQGAAPAVRPLGAPAPAASPPAVAPLAQPSAVVAPRSPAVGTSAAPAAVQPLVGTAPAAPAVRPLGAPAPAASAPSVAPAAVAPVAPLSASPQVRPLAPTSSSGSAAPMSPATQGGDRMPGASPQPVRPIQAAPIQTGSAPGQRIAPVVPTQSPKIVPQNTAVPVQQQVQQQRMQQLQRQQPQMMQRQQQQMRQIQSRPQMQAPARAPARAACTPQKGRRC